MIFLIKMELESLEKKDVLILGLGREGESTLKFLRKFFPKKNIGVADQFNINQLPKSVRDLFRKDKHLRKYLGKNYLNSLKNYSLIIKTPGIHKRTLKPYISKNTAITSQAEIFLKKFHKQTIGITGTKGKSTTSSLIYEILKRGGLRVHLLGNIGKPCLLFYREIQKDEIFVFELSSHQLKDLKISPHISIFLDIFKEHQDYFNNFREYFNAKANISKWQKKEDFFIFNSEYELIEKLSKKTLSKKIPFGLKSFDRKGCYLKNGWIFFKDKRVIDIRDVPLKGEHNIYNVMAAIGAAMTLKIPLKNIQEGIKKFKPLPHRLEFVGRFKGINFFNDSLATNPEATIEALKSIPNTKTLILGGFDRGQVFDGLIEEIIKRKINNLILLPPTGRKIYSQIKKNRINLNCFLVKNMKEVIEKAYEITEEGNCLLSPASASFGLFKNYKDRGNQFKKYVKLLSKK